MSAWPSNSRLYFYERLRDFDHQQPEVQAALGFARTCRDLLQRIASAWTAQRGNPASITEDLPGLWPLFELHLGLAGGSDPGWQPASELELLFAAVAGWLAGRYRADQPLATSYQVWVGHRGSPTIRLCGPVGEEPPPPGVLIDPDAGAAVAREMEFRPVTALGHYDVHGLAMLALTLRTLRRFGATETHGVLGFEQTGDIGKLWKRTVPQALKSAPHSAAVFMIDCPVHSRKPEHTLRALAQLDVVPGGEIYLIDHHPDTIQFAPRIARPGLQVVLTDVLSCGLLDFADPLAPPLQLLGALGDKVPEVAQACPPAAHPDIYAANDTFHRYLLQFSPTPPALKAQQRLPAEPLWEALAKGEPPAPGLALRLLGELPEVPAAPLPACAVCGALLFVTTRPALLGRSWYGMLEMLMEQQGRSYAVALRLLEEGRANMLLLTHWHHTHVPPIRAFIPEEYWPRCLGHDAAVWVDLDKSEALVFLRRVTDAVNTFFGMAASFAPVAASLQQNILDQAPTSQAGLATSGD